MKNEVKRAVQLAACYLSQKQFQEAEQTLMKYQVNGDSPEINYYLGLTYSLQGKYDEAIEKLVNSIGKDTGSSAARELVFQLLVNKANEALRNGDYSILSNALSKAIKYMPDKPEYKKILSHFESVLPVSYIKTGERENAAKIWLDELQRSSYSNPDILHNLALLYYFWALSNENEIASGQGEDVSQKRSLADYLWSQTIMFWFSFVNSQEYWDKLCADRADAWKTEITPETIKHLKSDISREKLLKVLEDFLEKYPDKKQQDNVRIQQYIILYHFEKKTAGYWNELREIIRHHKIVDPKQSEPVRKILALKGTFPLSFILKFFSDRNLIDDIAAVTSLQSDTDKTGELYENYHLACTYPDLFKIVVAIKELKDVELATKMWDDFASEPSNSDIIKKAPEAQFVIAVINYAKGNHYLIKVGILKAVQEWKIADKNLKNASEADKQKNCKTLISNLSSQLIATVIDECLKAAKKFNVDKKLDESISILEIAYGLTKNADIRSLLCANYSEKGFRFLNTENISKTKEQFKKALDLDRDYAAAKRGMAICKNNEGLDELKINNYDKAIRLFEEALNLDSDNTIRDNLASAYNYKAVKIINGLSPYSRSWDVDPAIEVIRKGIKLLNSDPNLNLDTLGIMLSVMDQNMFNNLTANMAEGTYKNLLYNLWVAEKSKSNLRGY
jgi:tetratricopeptide (TPR) repeat protein